MQLIQRYLTKNPYYKNNIDRIDSRYRDFQDYGPKGLMLHSVGCAQPDAQVFISKWDNESYTRACIHAFIDANTGVVWQTMPWNFRCPHCGGSANNTHIGVEMCESKWIKYPASGGVNFEILDRTKAVEDCLRTYHAAVELFAMLCTEWNLNPMIDIYTHKEGGIKGIASKHVDPEHYWSRLGMNYTMDTFRRDVKDCMEGGIDMTREELDQYLDQKFNAMREQQAQELQQICASLAQSYDESLTNALVKNTDTIDAAISNAVGPKIIHLSDIPWENVRETIRPYLEDESIDGGTDMADDALDIRTRLEFVRVLTWVARHFEKRLKELENLIAIRSE